MNRQKAKEAGRLRCFVTYLLPIIVLTSSIVVGACAKQEAPPTPEIPLHYTTFTDEAGLFSISYPPDWELALSLISDIEVAVMDVITSIQSDISVKKARVIFLAGLPIEAGYVPSVNIVVESIPGVGTNDRMVEAEVKGLKQIIPDYHEFSRVKTTVDGREATIFDWEGTYPQIGKGHVLQMMILVGKTAWIVTCTPPKGEFGKWKEYFQAIVKSLRIMK